MNSPRSLDRILAVDVHPGLRVELHVVVKPLGKVRRRTVFTRHNYFDLFRSSMIREIRKTHRSRWGTLDRVTVMCSTNVGYCMQRRTRPRQRVHTCCIRVYLARQPSRRAAPRSSLCDLHPIHFRTQAVGHTRAMNITPQSSTLRLSSRKRFQCLTETMFVVAAFRSIRSHFP